MGKIMDMLLDFLGHDVRAIHELKSWPDQFDALSSKKKTHEVRRFDRDFKVGDFVLLREYDPETKTYSGRQLLREIVHITPPASFGLPDDIGVLSVI